MPRKDIESLSSNSFFIIMHSRGVEALEIKGLHASHEVWKDGTASFIHIFSFLFY